MALIIGPGIVVAATGVGAGDLVAAAKAGSSMGMTVLWAAALGAVLKFALAEGVGRWHLATGTTVLEGWVKTFGRPLQIGFLIYLVIWTVVVSAALMSACGLAAHALVPSVSLEVWAVVHGILALLFVWFGGYNAFERAMKIVIAAMFIALVGSAATQPLPIREVLRGLLVPSVGKGNIILVMGVVGGVGGTLTLLSYNYWIKEKGWSGKKWIRGVRVDLAAGYLLTGLFGVAVILLAGTVLHPKGINVAGAEGVLRMAAILGQGFGRTGEIIFLIGFWGAVATSILGVWQGVPYLFGNYIGLLKGAEENAMNRYVSRKTSLYRGYALFMTFPPMLLFILEKPVWLIVTYAATGALFMPFLAATLLVMNNSESKLGELKNGWAANGALFLSLALFVYLGAVKLIELW